MYSRRLMSLQSSCPVYCMSPQVHCDTTTITNIHTLQYYTQPAVTVTPRCPVKPTSTVTSFVCPTLIPIPSSESVSNAGTDIAVAGADSTGLAVLGSFTVLLALILVVTITGWIYTAALVNRKKHRATNIW